MDDLDKKIFYDDSFTELDDCRLLFLSIIIQAIEDYLSVNPVGDSTGERKAAKLNAENWFRSNSRDYKEICANAERDSNKLRRLVITGDKAKLKKLVKEYRKEKNADREIMPLST